MGDLQFLSVEPSCNSSKMLLLPPLIKINLAERLAPAGGEQWSGLPRFLVPDPRRGLEKHKNDEAATRIM